MIKMTDDELLQRLGHRNGDKWVIEAAAARIRELLTALAALQPGENCERVRHLKTGGEYVVLGLDAELQWSGLKAVEGRKMTVYMGTDYRLWVRPSSEFRDGRFETTRPPGEVT